MGRMLLEASFIWALLPFTRGEEPSRPTHLVKDPPLPTITWPVSFSTYILEGTHSSHSKHLNMMNHSGSPGVAKESANTRAEHGGRRKVGWNLIGSQ